MDRCPYPAQLFLRKHKRAHQKATYATMGGRGFIEVEKQRPRDAEEEPEERAAHRPDCQGGKTEPEETPIALQSQR